MAKAKDDNELSGYALRQRLRKARKKYPFTSTEQALYQELIDECNEDDWSVVFTCANDDLYRALNISEKTLITARQTLIQQGLIYYKSGKSRRAYGSYSFTKQLTTETITTVKKPPTTVTITVDTTTDTTAFASVDTTAFASDINKEQTKTETETQTKTSVANATGTADAGAGQSDASKLRAPKNGTGQERKKGSVQKKKEPEDTTPHWPALVNVWFAFHEEKKLERPSFKGRDPAELKGIADNLQKRAKDKGAEWTEPEAIERLTNFLHFAYKREWVSKNFLLSILNDKFDAIINDNNSSNGKPKRAGIGGTSNGAGVIPSDRDYTQAKL